MGNYEQIINNLINYVSHLNIKSIFPNILYILAAIYILRAISKMVKRLKKGNLSISIFDYSLFEKANTEVISLRDFVEFPSYLWNYKSFLSMFLKCGLGFIFPSEALKKLFLNTLYIEFDKNLPKTVNNIEMRISKVLIVPEKCTRVTVEVKNISSEEQYFKMGFSENNMKKWVRLRINERSAVDIKTIEDDMYLRKKIIMSQEAILINFYFSTLSLREICKIESIRLILSLKKSQKGIITDYSLFERFEECDFQINELLGDEVDFDSLMKFFSHGGFLILSIPLLFILLLIDLWFIKLIFLPLVYFTLVFSINLNSKMCKILKSVINQKYVT